MIDSISLNFTGIMPRNTFEYVKALEAGRAISADAIGQVKTIKEYDNQGNLVKRTEFYYLDSDFPAKTSEIKVFTGGE